MRSSSIPPSHQLAAQSIPVGAQNQAVGRPLVDQLVAHRGSALKRGFHVQVLAGLAELKHLVFGRVLTERTRRS